MYENEVHLLDLPNEILYFIFKKLDNIHVLYSFLGSNNERLNAIVQDEMFTTNLDFLSISNSTDENCSTIIDSIFNRFHCSILPKIHQNIKSLSIESNAIKRILCAAVYSNLTELKLFNMNKVIASQIFIGKRFSRPFRSIWRSCVDVHVCWFHSDKCLIGCVPTQQIQRLTFFMNENNFEMTKKEYSETIYSHICVTFEHLKYLNISILSYHDQYPSAKNQYSVSLYDLSSTGFFSSTLTELHIHVTAFKDFVCLLDGRLKQLRRLFVEVDYMSNRIPPSANRVSFFLDNSHQWELVWRNID